MNALPAVLVLGGLFAGIAALLLLARRLLPAAATDDVVERIDALLPQSQCAQCGYPGCRPYAQAIVAGAAIDLCPPGGSATVEALARLLDRPAAPAAQSPPAAIARIRADDCIGCALCTPACPVDAIVGANGFRHVVLADACTGCGLCMPPCPVDCIELDTLPPPMPRLAASAVAATTTPAGDIATCRVDACVGAASPMRVDTARWPLPAPDAADDALPARVRDVRLGGLGDAAPSSDLACTA